MDQIFIEQGCHTGKSPDLGRRLKKKVDIELDVWFEDQIKTSGEKAYFAVYKDYLIAKLDTVISPKPDFDRVRKAEDRIFELYTPQQIGGKNGMEVKMKRSFEESMIVMSQYSKDPKGMTIAEYLAAISIITKKSKNNQKHERKGTHNRRK
jgi:hypothetical protein